MGVTCSEIGGSGEIIPGGREGDTTRIEAMPYFTVTVTIEW